MNTSLTIQTEAQLSEVKFSEQASIYNAFAAELDVKQIKKFRDKATGVARILKIQAEYSEKVDELVGDLDDLNGEEEQITKVEEPAKEAKRQTRFDMDAKIELIGTSDPKAGTIEWSLQQAILGCSHYDETEGLSQALVGDVVKEVIHSHKRPRSGLGVDEQYVVHNIKWFIKKGALKLISK